MLEDATGLSLKGDLDVHSVFAASLPTSHPSFAPQKHLEKLSKWKAPPLPVGNVELFIGILSAGNHFAERMAVRKSWLQHKLIKSSKVVARFFVALVSVDNVRNKFFPLENNPWLIYLLLFLEWKKGSKCRAEKGSGVFW